MSAMRCRAVARSAALVVLLVLVALGLWQVGDGSSGAPPLRSWRAAEDWYAAAGPELALVAVLRGVGLVLTAWLLVGASLELMAAVLGDATSRAAADLIAPRSLQRLVHGLAGLSLTAGLAVAAPGAGTLAAADEPGTATMRVVDGPDATTNGPPPAAPAVPAPVVPPPVAPAPAVLAPPVPAPASPQAPLDRRVRVEAGDCFWSISADVLADVLGRPAGDAEIAAHWRRLIDANRDRLVDPSNPDLLYPGQELVLPE